MARRTRPLFSILAAGALVAAAASTQSGPAQAKPPTRPTKVVIIVIDSLSKEIIDKYDMQNVQDLMADYVDTPNGYLGHTGSVTVVTHNVITSGQLPKHMGWTSEGYRDVANVLGGGELANPSNLYITSDATTDLTKLQNAARYPKLDAYLDAASPGSKQFVISPKSYAAFAFGSKDTDSIITFGSVTCTAPPVPVEGRIYGSLRGPTGVNPPSYITSECGTRYYVRRGTVYDTGKLPARMYPVADDRYVVGETPGHEGGDVWATEAALDVMANEDNWNGIFVTLPGVDKAAHMWGGVNDVGPTGLDGNAMTHLAFAAATADTQVGRIMDALEQSGELDNTLVVLTADHGSVSVKTPPDGTVTDPNFHGTVCTSGPPDCGLFNWYYGDAENDSTTYNQPQAALQPLIATGNIGLSYTDSMLSEWLTKQTGAKVDQAAAIMKDLPGVTAVWRRNGNSYTRVSPVKWDLMTSQAERDWFTAHAQELVDTQAAPYGPDLVATLPDDTTYSVAGDHGGIQRAAQQIPIVFAGAGLSSTDITGPVRSVDIMPTILKAMGITPTFKMDGIGYRLPTS
jgi:predicted AlkP superfamily pyrophosphatase or phosphodiesterase